MTREEDGDFWPEVYKGEIVFEKARTAGVPNAEILMNRIYPFVDQLEPVDQERAIDIRLLVEVHRPSEKSMEIFFSTNRTVLIDGVQYHDPPGFLALFTPYLPKASFPANPQTRFDLISREDSLRIEEFIRDWKKGKE